VIEEQRALVDTASSKSGKPDDLRSGEIGRADQCLESSAIEKNEPWTCRNLVTPSMLAYVSRWRNGRDRGRAFRQHTPSDYDGFAALRTKSVLHRIRADRWTLARSGWIWRLARLENLLTYPAATGCRCCLIYGDTGMGRPRSFRKFDAIIRPKVLSGHWFGSCALWWWRRCLEPIERDLYPRTIWPAWARHRLPANDLRIPLVCAGMILPRQRC